MTRINVGIKPEELCDKHLVAEYREIGRISKLLENRLKSNKGFDDIPPTFRLNKGHMKFFLDKGCFVHKRFDSLKE